MRTLPISPTSENPEIPRREKEERKEVNLVFIFVL